MDHDSDYTVLEPFLNLHGENGDVVILDLEGSLGNEVQDMLDQWDEESTRLGPTRFRLDVSFELDLNVIGLISDPPSLGIWVRR